MRKLALLALAAVVSVSAFVTGEASAEHLRTEPPPEKYSSCGYHDAEVAQWTPASGPVAGVIADAFLAHGGSLWMALGYDDTGFWSVQGFAADGPDDGDTLDLVHADFATGKETRFPVVDEKLKSAWADNHTAARRDSIKRRVFSLAAKAWPVAKLRHDYKLRLPKHDSEGKIENFTGWMVEVSKKDGFLLRYAQIGLPFMCWCNQTWKAYTLAKPKAK